MTSDFAKVFRQRLQGLSLLLRRGRPRFVLGCDIGLGDEVMLTAVVREIRARKLAGGIWILARRPEIFAGNPEISLVLPHDAAAIEMLHRIGLPPSFIHYTSYDPINDSDERPASHFVAIMASKLRFAGRIAIEPRLSLAEEESAQADEFRDAIVVQSTCVRSQGTMLNKEWGPTNFQALVAKLNPQRKVVQVGLESDPALEGAIHLQGKLSLRQTAAVLAKSAAFVGLASGLMHLARAVNRRSVIIYGGREEPEKSGYPCNENLLRTPPCSPCWVRNRCDFQRVCLSEITPDDVVQALGRLLARRKDPLEIQQAEIPVLAA